MNKIFNKDIIFANNHPYLTFEDIDSDDKGFFNYSDLQNAVKGFSEEGVSDFFKEFEKEKVDKDGWLRYIKNDKPYGEETTNEFLRFAGGKNKERRRVKEAETNRIYDSNDVLIIQPKSYRSMVLYGYDTKWCYSSASTDEHYNDVKDESLFYIIFNTKNKDEHLHYRSKPKQENYSFYKFLLMVNKQSNICFFEDQTNRLLTRKCTYDQDMIKTDENSIRHMDFLFKNKTATKELECSILSQIQI